METLANEIVFQDEGICTYITPEEMIKKVYEADPPLCPKCGAQMAIFSFIEDHKVIDKIIRHLKLTFYAEHPPPPQVVQQELLMAAAEREEYF